MNKESQSQVAEAHKMLKEAKRANESGQHGAALKQAYHSSEYIAAAYLSGLGSQVFPPNNASFDLFAKTIRELNSHSDMRQKIWEIVGDVYVLREAYEPALLDETTSKDAQQMIEHVTALSELVEEVI